MVFEYVRTSSPAHSLDTSSVSSSPSSSGGGSSHSNEGPSSLSLVPSVLPDLRFEQSYIASIRAFIHEFAPEQAKKHEEQVALEKKEAKGGSCHASPLDQKHGAPWIVAGHKGDLAQGSQSSAKVRKQRTSCHCGEPELWIGRLTFDWLPLVTITIRDQIFLPLFQGALWGVVGHFLNQARGVASNYLSTHIADAFFRMRNGHW